MLATANYVFRICEVKFDIKLSLPQVIIILRTYFFSSVQGVTGLGLSTICLPFMALTVGLKAALQLLFIPSLASNLKVMRQAGHFSDNSVQILAYANSYCSRCLFGLNASRISR